MVSAIIKRTNSSSVDDEESVRTVSSSAKRGAVTSKLAAVSAKLEDGDIKAAVGILCSDEVIADYSAETLATLQLKYPSSTRVSLTHQSCLPAQRFKLEKKASSERPLVSSRLIIGPDSLKPLHLVEMVLLSGQLGPHLHSDIWMKSL